MCSQFWTKMTNLCNGKYLIKLLPTVACIKFQHSKDIPTQTRKIRYLLSTMIKLVGKFPDLYFSLYSVHPVSLFSIYLNLGQERAPHKPLAISLFTSRKMIHILILKYFMIRKLGWALSIIQFYLFLSS